MPRLDHLRRRFRHHAWAGSVLTGAVDATPAPDALRPLAHALAADAVWHSRLTGIPSDITVWPDLDAAGCRQLWATTTAGWRTYLASLDRPEDLDTIVAYQNTRGDAFESSVADVLDHVLLHAAHHRGQVNVALRVAGTSPPSLDVIAWTRAGEPS